MYLLDTSVLIALFEKSEISSEISDFIGDNEFFISPLTTYEILMERDGQYFIDTKERLNKIQLVPFTSKSADVAVEIYKDLKKKGKMIKHIDILIASCALKNNLIVLTLDNHFKNISNLRTKIFELNNIEKN